MIQSSSWGWCLEALTSPRVQATPLMGMPTPLMPTPPTVSAPTPPMPPPEVMVGTALPGMLLVETLPPGMLLPEMLLRAKTLPRREMLEMAVGEGGDGGCRVLRARLGMGR